MTPSEQKFEAAIYRKLNQERLERAVFDLGKSPLVNANFAELEARYLHSEDGKEAMARMARQARRDHMSDVAELRRQVEG